jgi:hypothetical protein
MFHQLFVIPLKKNPLLILYLLFINSNKNIFEVLFFKIKNKEINEDFLPDFY